MFSPSVLGYTHFGAAQFGASSSSTPTPSQLRLDSLDLNAGQLWGDMHAYQGTLQSVDEDGGSGSPRAPLASACLPRAGGVPRGSMCLATVEAEVEDPLISAPLVASVPAASLNVAPHPARLAVPGDAVHVAAWKTLLSMTIWLAPMSRYTWFDILRQAFTVSCLVMHLVSSLFICFLRELQRYMHGLYIPGSLGLCFIDVCVLGLLDICMEIDIMFL